MILPQILFSLLAAGASKVPEIRELELSDFIDFSSGIFAAFLLALSLLAYKNTKSKRLLFVSAAFGLFALRALLARLDLLVLEIQSTVIELILALSGFVILSLFFLAIVRK